ncbi:hypothetical protein HMPREF9520_03062 [Enterococcus faecalis TX1467]|nr:hypothetical protein HMPREF9520_03062 [Enterococcus faecalis TX1467]
MVFSQKPALFCKPWLKTAKFGQHFDIFRMTSAVNFSLLFDTLLTTLIIKLRKARTI